MSGGSAKFFTFLFQACVHTETPPTTHIHTHTTQIPFPDFLHTQVTHVYKIVRLGQSQPHTHFWLPFPSLPRMKGPALLALLPDIPGHCSLLALPDVSPAPLSDERRLDILELYRGINQISTLDKDSQVKRVNAYMWLQGHKRSTNNKKNTNSKLKPNNGFINSLFKNKDYTQSF